ncbi:MAG: hypothetical protein HYY85_16860 [Deltaproteobacteria bacterium]|nr:hypothetical protein [Deltaproteobacteria bacterium]
MVRRIALTVIRWASLAVVVAGVAACSQQQQATATPQPEEKTFALSPASAPVRAAFLTGELQDLKVTGRVEPGSGKFADPPQLQATLKLKNTSNDQTARLIGGEIGYVDGAGEPIPLAEDQRKTTFQFSSWQTERLNPGMEISQHIEVPFPAAAIEEKKLRGIRLELSYIPTPYKEETVSIPVSLAPEPSS